MASLSQNIYCLLYYLFVCFIGYNWTINSHYKYRDQNRVGLLVFILFSILTLTYFADSDYFHYKVRLNEFSNNISGGIEIIYVWIGEIVSYNYILFRAVIWISALLIFCFIAKILRISINHSLYFLFVVFIGLFAYARASLGMCVLVCGLVLYLREKKVLNKLIGLVIFISSCFFHNSLIIAILIGIVSIFLRLNKKNITFLLVLSVLMSVIITEVFVYLLSNPLSDAYLMTKLSYYTSESYSGSSDVTLLGKVRGLLEIGIFVLPVYYMTKSLLKYEKSSVSCLRSEIVLNNLCIIIVLLSMAIQSLPLGTNVFAYRIRYMALIPISIVMVSLTDRGMIKFKSFKICLLLGFLYEVTGLISNLKHSL